MTWMIALPWQSTTFMEFDNEVSPPFSYLHSEALEARTTQRVYSRDACGNEAAPDSCIDDIRVIMVKL